MMKWRTELWKGRKRRYWSQLTSENESGCYDMILEGDWLRQFILVLFNFAYTNISLEKFGRKIVLQAC